MLVSGSVVPSRDHGARIISLEQQIGDRGKKGTISLKVVAIHFNRTADVYNKAKRTDRLADFSSMDRHCSTVFYFFNTKACPWVRWPKLSCKFHSNNTIS